ncbi:Adaptive-response sensory-kinase SasA [wastewater metagenome]|uniref:histidine kinase n=2 Tax=unclassified sequences TaxID=12908 RepID=A0A5B8RI25_9ZZZZ|nr:adaptive-response sensory-kinase SasA [uncultured organism]
MTVTSRAAIPEPVPRTRRWRARALVAAAAIAVAAVVLAGTWWLARESAYAGLRTQSANDLRLYIANVRRELEKFEYLPSLLADDSRLQRLLRNPADALAWRSVNRYLQLAANVSNAAAIYLLDDDGLTVAASNFDDADSFIGDNYSFRPYYQQAAKGRLGRFYALGITSNRRGYYFASPVGRGDDILGVVVVKVPLAPLERERGGSGREFIVTDPAGVIFLSTEPSWRFKTLHPLTAPQRRRIESTQRYPGRSPSPLQRESTTALADGGTLVDLGDGGSFLRQERGMPTAGWRVHVMADTAPVYEQIVRSVLLAAASLFAIALAAGVFAQRRARLAERRRFEQASMEAAAANAERVRAIIDNTRAGLVTLTADGRIASLNPTAETLLGRSSDSVSGDPLTGLFDGGDRRTLEQGLRMAAETATPPLLEVSAHHGDGSDLPLEVAVSAMDLPEGRRYLVTLHDLSERKAGERALREAHDQLEQRVSERTRDLLTTNRRLSREIEEHQRTEAALTRTRDELVQAAKLAAIGQLAAGINHEINQPLTAIRAYADNARLLLDHDREDDARGNLSLISDLTGRMARIVNQLKLFSRKSTGTPVAVSVPAAVDDALALLDPQLSREGVAVFRHWDAAPLYCLGDTVRLEQVFVNLIGNAAQAMSEAERREVHVTLHADGDWIEVRVRDTGPGIDDEHLAQIFETFFTTKDTGQGLGLGLSISARIIEEMGGTMHADNDPEGGAVFTVTLPRTTEDANGE